MENEIKLVKLSTKSWHYKLVKWFLGDKAPGPHNTFNFCRYFWIFMFCLLVLTPIYGPFKLLGKIIMSVGNFVDKYLTSKLSKGFSEWMANLDINSVYNIYSEGTYGNVPKKYRKNKLGGYYREDVLSTWAKEHLGLDWYKWEDREKILTEINKINAERKALNKEKMEIQRKRCEANELKAKKRAELIAKINNKLGFIGDAWDYICDSVGNLLAYDYTKMIKVAKRVFGVILTGIFLVLSFYFVNILSYCFIWLTGIVIDNSKPIIITIGIIIVIGLLALLLALLYQFLSEKISKIIKLYKSGGSVWYIQVFYWIIVKPIHYLVYKPIYWIVMIPLNFIFNHILWQFICVKLISRFAIWFWKGFVNFTGIFGEYFAASKGDYCPGVGWDE